MRLALLAAAIVAGGGGSASLGAQNFVVETARYADLTWRCIGPFDGGPIDSVQGVAGQSGVYLVTTPSGGAWKTIDGGETWAPVEGTGPAIAGDPHRWVDPSNPRRVVRVATNGIEVSLDASATWTTFHHLPIAEVAHLAPRQSAVESSSRSIPRRIGDEIATVSIADPVRPGLIFAGTKSAVHVSFDGGLHWSPLQLNMPAVAINDLDIRGHDLVAATQGRSTWILDDISLLRQLGPAAATAPAVLFKPADAVLAAPGLHIDYYLGADVSGDVTLDVLDATGRVVHRAQSAAPDATDHWLPVTRPLAVSRGHHRVLWNLRFDPPPAPRHRFEQLARTLFENAPADPDGPVVMAGSYRVRLTASGRSYIQPIVVRSDPRATPAQLQVSRQQFDLAMKAYDAMEIAHRSFLQLAPLRAAIRSLMKLTDTDIAAAATDLDTRLNVIDGSDWTGFILPDVDQDTGDVEEEEEFVKHPDFVPPIAVGLNKDYDDPTSILGRKFASVIHAPALAILASTFGGMVEKAGRDAPDALALDSYARACTDLAGVLDQWRAINAVELPRLNTDLGNRRLPRLPVTADVPAIACAPVR
jgi:hypothetical protein